MCNTSISPRLSVGSINGKTLILVLFVTSCWYSIGYGSITILNPAYQVETYAVVNRTNRIPTYLETDDSGNLYISEFGDPHGDIIQIAPDKTVATFNTNLENLHGIVWGGGSAYGDFLYQAEVYSHSIQQVDSNGTFTTFSTLPNQPVSLELDRTGNFGNALYTGTRYGNAIYRVDDSGGYTLFKSFSATSGSYPFDIAFDHTGQYNGNMYVSMTNLNETNLQGILEIDPDGNVTQFRTGGYYGGLLEFDTTDNLDFGGSLFFAGGSAIRRVSTDGTLTNFATSNRFMKNFTFSSDGAMYVMEIGSGGELNGPITISKITLVPEPGALALLGLGGLWLRRRRRA